jgi:hypothetical protein
LGEIHASRELARGIAPSSAAAPSSEIVAFAPEQSQLVKTDIYRSHRARLAAMRFESIELHKDIACWSEAAAPDHSGYFGCFASAPSGCHPMPCNVDFNFSYLRIVPPAKLLAQVAMSDPSKTEDGVELLKQLDAIWEELHEIIDPKVLLKYKNPEVPPKKACFYSGFCMCGREFAKLRSFVSQIVAALRRWLVQGSVLRVLYDKAFLVIGLKATDTLANVVVGSMFFLIGYGNLNTFQFELVRLEEHVVGSLRSKRVQAHGGILCALSGGSLLGSMGNLWASLRGLNFDHKWDMVPYQLCAHHAPLPSFTIAENIVIDLFTPYAYLEVWKGRHRRRHATPAIMDGAHWDPAANDGEEPPCAADHPNEEDVDGWVDFDPGEITPSVSELGDSGNDMEGEACGGDNSHAGSDDDELRCWLEELDEDFGDVEVDPRLMPPGPSTPKTTGSRKHASRSSSEARSLNSDTMPLSELEIIRPAAAVPLTPSGSGDAAHRYEHFEVWGECGRLLGHLHFDPIGKKLNAHCKNPEHSKGGQKCKLDRQLTGNGTKGRPLGFLVAWLRNAYDEESKGTHDDLKPALKSISGLSFRRSSRQWLKEQPGFAFMFRAGVERPKCLPDEDSEQEVVF